MLEESFFSLHYNLLLVMLTAGVSGAVIALIGVPAVLRRHALVSDALAHATLPGLAGVFLLFTAINANNPLVTSKPQLSSGFVAVHL